MSKAFSRNVQRLKIELLINRTENEFRVCVFCDSRQFYTKPFRVLIVVMVSTVVVRRNCRVVSKGEKTPKESD